MDVRPTPEERPMKSRTPTIRRRASWPVWSRYYCVDENGRCSVFSHRPEMDEHRPSIWSCWSYQSVRHHFVRGPRLSPRTASLRRIAP